MNSMLRMCFAIRSRLLVQKGYQHHKRLIRVFQERREIFRFINEHAKFPVEKMCKVFKVSVRGYYTLGN